MLVHSVYTSALNSNERNKYYTNCISQNITYNCTKLISTKYKKSDLGKPRSRFYYLIVKPKTYSHSIVADGFGDIS